MGFRYCVCWLTYLAACAFPGAEVNLLLISSLPNQGSILAEILRRTRLLRGGSIRGIDVSYLSAASDPFFIIMF